MKTVRDGGSSRFFSKRIGGVGVHVVGRIDDDHPVAAVMRGHRQEAVDPPDLVDGDDRLEALGLLVWGRVRCKTEGCAPMAIWRNRAEPGSGMASSTGALSCTRILQQMIGEVKGQRRLADAERAGKAAAHAAACRRDRPPPASTPPRRGRTEHGFSDGSGMPSSVSCCSGAMRSNIKPPAPLPGSACDRASSAAKTAAVTTFSTASASAEASMTMQRSGSFSAMARKASGGAGGWRASPSRSGRPRLRRGAPMRARSPSSGSMSKISVMSGIMPLTRNALDLVQKRGIDIAGRRPDRRATNRGSGRKARSCRA